MVLRKIVHMIACCNSASALLAWLCMADAFVAEKPASSCGNGMSFFLPPLLLNHLSLQLASSSSSSRSFGTTLTASTASSTVDEYPYVFEAEDAEAKLKRSFSLAGSYLVDCGSGPSGSGSDSETVTTTVWSLFPLDDLEDINKATFPSEGSRAWAALQCHPRILREASIQLRADWREDGRMLHITSSQGSNAELVAVLSRLIAQSALVQAATRLKFSADESLAVHISSEVNSIALTLSNSDVEKLLSESTDWNSDDDGNVNASNKSNIVYTLFADLDTSPSEIVEMVNSQGLRLGFVPRRLVHKHNLLHRGIGVLVTRDQPLCSISSSDEKQQQQQPDLYCHRRTDNKRVFPSLYDMFVGGVSLANEKAAVTARREVAEELGITAALTGAVVDNHDRDAQRSSPQQQQQLSERLLQCVVCTAYNRCVVDLFAYTCDTRSESVTWQPEEVAWGAFVPYAVVEAAADRSIQRLVDLQEWPGRYPPVQSQRHGEIEHEWDTTLHDETVREWRFWDFVPDGLLVWEAWLKAVE